MSPADTKAVRLYRYGGFEHSRWPFTSAGICPSGRAALIARRQDGLFVTRSNRAASGRPSRCGLALAQAADGLTFL
jgi:hypothetical protein